MPEEKKEPLRYRPLGDVDFAPKKSEDIIEGKPTVTMTFPKRVLLNHGGVLIEFKPGVHEVPVEISYHWFLKAHGAELRDKPEVVAPSDDSEEEEVEEDDPTSTPAEPKPKRRVKRRRRKKATEKPVEQVATPEPPKE